MKNATFFLLGFSALAGLFLLISCDKSNNVENMELSISDIHDELVRIKNEYDGSRTVTEEQGMLFTSKILIDITDTDGGKVITLATMNKENSQYVNYFIQIPDDSEKGITLLTGTEFEAEILFIKRTLIVTPLNGKDIIMLSLITENRHDIVEGIGVTNIVEGYGIGKYSSTIGALNSRHPPTCFCQLKSLPDTNCDAGGKGSASCSVSTATQSCTTSCANVAEERYACCRYNN